MKLYVIRHGQTKCNKENKYNCRLDEDINEIGIKQAEDDRWIGHCICVGDSAGRIALEKIKNNIIHIK